MTVMVGAGEIHQLPDNGRVVPGVDYLIGVDSLYSCQDERFVDGLGRVGVDTRTDISDWSVEARSFGMRTVFVAAFEEGELVAGARYRIRGVVEMLGYGEGAGVAIAEGDRSVRDPAAEPSIIDTIGDAARAAKAIADAWLWTGIILAGLFVYWRFKK